MTEVNQKNAFEHGEGDAWYQRSLNVDIEHIYRDRLLDYVSPGDSVLEVGSSDGRNLSWLLAHGVGRCCGIDPSAQAVAEGGLRHPELDLRFGTADRLPVAEGETFDLVWLGFFLYLVDRALLTKVVAETDRVTRDGGTVVIVDFDSPQLRRRPYRHCDGLMSFKMDYSTLFTAFPHYVVVEKVPIRDAAVGLAEKAQDRIALWILKKDLTGAYALEHDDD
jgi:ubiquinone/menaquinone biosynthesis C-methylase UbiE